MLGLGDLAQQAFVVFIACAHVACSRTFLQVVQHQQRPLCAQVFQQQVQPFLQYIRGASSLSCYAHLIRAWAGIFGARFCLRWEELCVAELCLHSCMFRMQLCWQSFSFSCIFFQ